MFFEQYLPTELVESLVKVAEERAEHPVMRGLKTLGTSVAGMGLGAGAGLGLAYGAERMGLNVPAKYIVPAAGALGMGTALAEASMREKQMEEMKDALKRRYKNS